MVSVSLSALLKQRALEIGLDLVGIAPLAVWQDLEFSRKWVAQGFGGEMRYLRNPMREDPRRLLPSVKSVICVGLIYNTDYPYSTELGGGEARSQKSEVRRKDQNCPARASSRRFSSFGSCTSKARAWISRYAWGRNYHEVVRAKLEKLCAAVETIAPGTETRAYVDTGPIVERAFARYSGIGWMGKNTCLINERKGSWFFLGVLLTSLELEPDLPALDRCGSCTRCLEACPTGALVEPYVMDASRCISYFTIELKGSIPAGFRSGVGTNVFGCDICQDVCPWNSRAVSAVRGQSSVVGASRAEGRQTVPQGVSPGGAQKPKVETTIPLSQPPGEGPRVRVAATTTVADFQPRQVTSESRTLSLFNPSLEDLASITEEDFRRSFRHSPIKRAKYRGWLRNLCVAMGNSGDLRFIPWLERAREHAGPVVREHAEWALEQIYLSRPPGTVEQELL